ncbi:lipoprotein [Moraxella pluranimalium]|uniref:Uncharacterized protein n=1 Tax=Moraxella pluranimalium TaxID=470453 RepID=A0A1T0CSA0_9GAMM|nr:hypothetical protein [Moraxella pluranimalium]OOS25099.1 hypothetical protein B0680_03075 [Moraxella pluranimalium]
MRKLFPTMVLLALLAGCGNSEQPEQQTEAQTEQTEQKSTEWYQDDLSQPVEKVGVNNAQEILKSAGLTAAKVSDSTDNKGEPKKIYKLGDSSLSAQLEHSKNEIIIAWYQAEDTDSGIELSQKSVKDAYLLGRAVLGADGVDIIRRISRGGFYKQEPFNDFILTGNCFSGLCSVNIRVNQ